jgi:hypothetical protein
LLDRPGLTATGIGPIVELARPGIYELRYEDELLLGREALIVGPLPRDRSYINRSTLPIFEPTSETGSERGPLRATLLWIVLGLGLFELFTQARGWTE